MGEDAQQDSEDQPRTLVQVARNGGRSRARRAARSWVEAICWRLIVSPHPEFGAG